ncbi:MAG: O-antigen ligase family protein [Candidatus Auribacterota bacterium]|nr:O-antigen ligase family protein [Candidatus Auribacterota bacterium]
MEKFRQNYRILLLILILITVFFSVLGRFSLNRPSSESDPGQPVFQLEISGMEWAQFSMGGKIRNLIYLALLAWLAGCIWDKKLRPARSGLEIPVFIYLGAALLAFFFSSEQALSWKTGLRNLLIQGAWFFLILSVLRREKYQKAVLIVLFCSLSLTVLAGLSLYGRDIFFPQTPERIWLSFGHPNSSGAVLVLLIPCALAPLFFRPPRWVGILSGLFAALLFIALFLSFSRTAWISLLLGLGILTARRKAKYFYLGLIIVLVGLLVWGLNVGPQSYWKQRIKSFASWRSDPNINKRMIYWEAACRMIENRPFVGYGPGYGGFQKNYEKKFKKVDTGERVTAAHNFYLSQAVSTGLIGLAAFLGLIVMVFRSAWREYCRSPDWFGKSYSLGLIAGLAGFLVGSLIDDPLLNERISFLFWLLLGILAARMANRAYSESS